MSGMQRFRDFLIAAGATHGRLLRDRFGDIMTVHDFGAVYADGVTDNLTVFRLAAASGKRVVVPYAALAYVISDYLDFASGTQFIGLGLPTLKMITNPRTFRCSSVNDILIDGFAINGNGGAVLSGSVATIAGCQRVTLRRCVITDAAGGIGVSGATENCLIEENEITDCLGTAIGLSGSGVKDNRVVGNRITDAVGFGVWLNSGANRNAIAFNKTRSNGLELVGITYDCWGNRVIGNHAEGCGDNGISVTGFGNVISANICRGNQFDGIYAYGRSNTITGNKCINNGQVYLSTAAQHAGINIGGFFGGTAQDNVITGNHIDDDQAVPTQYNGIKINAVGYSAWVTATVYAIGDYVSVTDSSRRLYKATTAGTSGASAPTHTSSTASDGGVTWQYVDTFFGATREPYGNIIGPNRINRSIGSKIQDNTTNNNNVIVDEDHIEFFGSGKFSTLTGGLARRTDAWTSSQAIIFGDLRRVNAIVYRCTNVGGTAANVPVHSVGAATLGDGIEWTVLFTSSQLNKNIELGVSNVQINSPFGLRVINSTTYVADFAGSGSPEGVVTAIVGSTYRDASDGRIWSKISGSGATGWSPIGNAIVTVDADGRSIAASETGSVYSNEGATALAAFNLPTAAANLEFAFIVQDVDGIEVVANTGDTIRLGSLVSASAGNIQSTTIGSVVHLVAINATEWIATKIVGTWTVT